MYKQLFKHQHALLYDAFKTGAEITFDDLYFDDESSKERKQRLELLSNKPLEIQAIYFEPAMFWQLILCYMSS